MQATAIASVVASVGPTPKSSDVSSRLRPRAAARPRPSPACAGSVIHSHCGVNQSLSEPLWQLLSERFNGGKADERVLVYGDVLHTVVFLVNGYSSGVWEEVSETKHRHRSFRIFRDAAFDHADKTWYGVEFDESVFDQKPDWSARRG